MSRAYSLGAVDYIASPVVPEILRAKVRVFVELYLLAEQAKRQAQERITLIEEKAAREAAERASVRLAFLAEASAALASSLDLEATLRELSRFVVPRFADVGIVSLVAAEGQPERHEMAWSTNEEKEPLLRASLAALGDSMLDAAVLRVRDSGRPETIQRDPAGHVESRIALPRGLAVHALMLVPLLVGGRRLGVLTLGLEAASRRFDPDALAMVAELASRGATALDNALLFRKIQDEAQRKNEFLAMLAHELRNPLAPISNAVHILRVSEDEPAKVAWARELIGRQLKQLVRLVDDLLDVSRITRGKIELKIETVDVAQVVAAAIETSRPNIDAHRHTLSLQLPVEPLLDPGRLRAGGADPVQPGQQRREVHADGRPHLAVGDAGRRRGRIPHPGFGRRVFPPSFSRASSSPSPKSTVRSRGHRAAWASASPSFAAWSKCRAVASARAAKAAIAAASSRCACRSRARPPARARRLLRVRCHRLRDCAYSSSTTIATWRTARRASCA